MRIFLGWEVGSPKAVFWVNPLGVDGGSRAEDVYILAECDKLTFLGYQHPPMDLAMLFILFLPFFKSTAYGSMFHFLLLAS